jgi:hypothetical protein
MTELVVIEDRHLPALIAEAGDHAARRFLEFFTVNIRNVNTRNAYGRAVGAFLRWLPGSRHRAPAGCAAGSCGSLCRAVARRTLRADR